MYPNVAPELEVRSTISHESRPEEVVGFFGRNKKLGRSAIILKDSAVEGERIVVPSQASAALIDENAELVVLEENLVKAMNASDFETEREVTTMKGRGKPVRINLVKRTSDNFRIFTDAEVEVGL